MDSLWAALCEARRNSERNLKNVLKSNAITGKHVSRPKCSEECNSQFDGQALIDYNNTPLGGPIGLVHYYTQRASHITCPP